jgi:hypothetical protein
MDNPSTIEQLKKISSTIYQSASVSQFNVCLLIVEIYTTAMEIFVKLLPNVGYVLPQNGTGLFLLYHKNNPSHIRSSMKQYDIAMKKVLFIFEVFIFIFFSCK